MHQGFDQPLARGLAVGLEHISMTTDEAITAFRSLSREQQIRFLVSYAHWLSLVGRNTYEAGTENVLNPKRLREINEVQHRVVGQTLKLLDEVEDRYPDDVLATIIVMEADEELLWVFEKALQAL
jgi:hypothetical protein